MSSRRARGALNRLPGTNPSGALRRWLGRDVARQVVLPFLIGLPLILSATAHAEIAVRLSPETASLFLYEPFTLRLEVECDAPPEPPELPRVAGLAVTAVRRLAADPARRQHAFQIELLSERDGILILPPFAVRADGEAVMTPAIRLRISSPRPATEMTLKVSVEPTALRVGQPATVTVTWTSQVPFTRCKQLFLELPLLTDTRCRLFPLEPSVPDDQRIGLPVNNLRLVAQAVALPDGGRSLSFRLKLIPNEPCVLRTQPVRLVCALLEGNRSQNEAPSYFYNHFFEAADKNEVHQRIYLNSPVPTITVTALKETGRNARFANIVGPCAIRVSASPTRLQVGQPATFTVQLEKLAFARHIQGLPSAAFAGLRPEFQLSEEPIRESASDDSRSFTSIIRPLQPGLVRIPAVVIQTYDPDSDEYRTVRSDPIPITVEPLVDDGAGVINHRLTSKPPVRLHGIRHNRASEQTMMALHDVLEFLGRYWWAFVPLPLLLWLALLPLARRWERCRRDPVYARAVAARRRFLRGALRDEEAAWRDYLADRLALCAEALTAETVIEALRVRNVSESLVDETRRRFEERDAVDYGKRTAAPRGSTRSLVRRLHKATIPLWLLFVACVPLRTEAADRPDELFARALRMRGVKPDEAEPLFVEAALRFESSKQLVNAGNSWFFAGETGRALANYRAAERRSPFDRQLRESIEFLRANRADSFPAPASRVGKLAPAWNRLCTWAVVLRVGMFVLAYLVAWTIFLSAQLAGWRICRVCWIVIAIAVLVPLASVAYSSFLPVEGVVIEDTIARLGPGYAYDAAFQQPLHRAAEFSWLETRQGWVRARLPDASEGWLRESDCMKVE